ncbi:hypothetical protein B0H14DRAFT_3434496 [Mycena olivaceomarginata]|nr:hypothetical protein B0H14DRAFT_3434496 [Mycena olivaceomarginata]
MGSCASKNTSRAPWKFPGFPTFFGPVDFSEDGIVRALRSWRVYAGSGYAVFDFEFDQNKGTLSFFLSPPHVAPAMRHISRPLYFKKLHRRGRNLLRPRLRPVPAPYGLANSGGWGGWGTGPGWGDEPGWGEESEDHAPADLQSVCVSSFFIITIA